MTTTAQPLVDDYLGRLEQAARPLPRRQRDELVAEIRAHLDAGLEQTATEAEVRNLLDDLGEPADIVAAAQPDSPAKRPAANEIVAVLRPTSAKVIGRIWTRPKRRPPVWRV